MTSESRWGAVARHAGRSLFIRSSCVLSGAVLAASALAFAQDPFEIHVLEYEDLQPGEFTLEVHTNYVGQGTATQDQAHITFELTGAVTPEFSFGVMQLNERIPGYSPREAGWRLAPHFYAPARWRLAVLLGLTAEFSFEEILPRGSTRTLELLPIVEKRFGRWKADLNPTVGKVLSGIDLDRGWDFGLAARIAYDRMRRFTPGLEYYSDFGALPEFLPLRSEVHQIVPGGDLHLARNVTWNVGVGIGLTSSGDRLFYKSRLEINWGGTARPQ